MSIISFSKCEEKDLLGAGVNGIIKGREGGEEKRREGGKEENYVNFRYLIL